MKQFASHISFQTTHTKSKNGGYLKGKPHSEGGEKFIVASTGQLVELEGGEAVINKKSISDDSEYSIKGTPREIASCINELHGGKNFRNENSPCNIKKIAKGDVIEDKEDDSWYVVTAYDMDLEKRVHFSQPLSKEKALANKLRFEKEVKEVAKWDKENKYKSRFSDLKIEKLVDLKAIPKDGNCPVGTQIQSILIDKKYFTKSKAIGWIDKHGYKVGLDEKEKTFRFRQRNPNDFHKDLFRTITLTKGVKAVIGCPVDKSISYSTFASFSKKDIEKGIEIEMEHKDTILQIKKNPNLSVRKVAEMIAVDHLKENGNYYKEISKIEKMEDGGEVKKSLINNPFDLLFFGIKY